MLEVLALLGCILALGYVLYYVLAIAVAVVLFPIMLAWYVLKLVLVLILAPLLLICGLVGAVKS